jgi:hypothetical protein
LASNMPDMHVGIRTLPNYISTHADIAGLVLYLSRWLCG